MPVIAVLNRSSLDDEDVAFFAAAADAQLREDLMTKWEGVDYTPVLFFASDKDLPTASGVARLMIIQDTIDQADAAGYHQFVGVPRSIILAQGEQTSVTMSHEALEMSADPNVYEWVKMPDGRHVAVEIADPVESNVYMKTVTILGKTRDIFVSAFVGPEWFQPGQPGAFTLAPGGYMVIDDGGNVSPVFADETGRKRYEAKQSNPSSRINARTLAP